MWNVFDTTFIVITAIYLILRLKGLSSGDRELYLSSRSNSTPDQVGVRFITDSTSDLGFDILACGACILFPRSGSDAIYFCVCSQGLFRLAFFLVSDNVVILCVSAFFPSFSMSH